MGIEKMPKSRNVVVQFRGKYGPREVIIQRNVSAPQARLWQDYYNEHHVGKGLLCPITNLFRQVTGVEVR